MRHRRNKLLQIRGSVQSRDLVMRTMLTNLVRYGHLTTTEKKAKVLIAYADSFFSKLVSLSQGGADGAREVIRWTKSIIFGNEEGKKVVSDLLPGFVAKKCTTNFLTHVRIGRRLGDAAEEVRIDLIK